MDQNLGPVTAEDPSTNEGVDRLALPAAVNGTVNSPRGETPSQQVSPAKEKAKGRGRAAGKPKVTTKVTKPMGRGRHRKAYESVKAQAAYERHVELKAAWNSLVKLVKPALAELADRSLKKLRSGANAHLGIPEAETCHRFLDQRLADTIDAAGRRLDMDKKLNEATLQTNQTVTNAAFVVGCIHSSLCNHLTFSTEPSP